MQNDEPDFPKRNKSQAKSCCLFVVLAVLMCFLLAMGGIAAIVVVDSINLRGEDHTLEWRVKRYKVACQFLWFDFKDVVSRRFSRPKTSEPESVQGPSDSPESVPEFGPESAPEP